MARRFCLSCGEPTGAHEVCRCGVTVEVYKELERRENEHLAAYACAWPLSVNDLNRMVASGGGHLTVQELLRTLDHPDEVIKELAMRATERGVVQLVYEKNRGSQLLFWPWV